MDERETLAKYLGNWQWRMNNLYKIRDVEGRKVQFVMNEVQEEIFDGLWYHNIILKARQFGVTTFFCVLFLDRVLFRPNVECALVAQGMTESGDLFKKKVLYAYDNLPNELKHERPLIKRDSGEIIVDHGGNGRDISSFRIAVTLRSSTMQYLHISEFGKICARSPEKAEEIVSGSFNAGPSCVVTVESTAEGRDGYFFDMCQTAEKKHMLKDELTKMDYKFFFLPWWKHPDYYLELPESGMKLSSQIRTYFEDLKEKFNIVLKDEQMWWYQKKYEEQGNKIKQEFPSTSAEAFEKVLEGAYYGEQMNKVYEEGRISDEVKYDPSLPVHTSWDIGHGDATSICFFQIVGSYIHFIDFYENSEKGMPHYINYLRTKKKHYNYGRHIGPHDLAVREWGSGNSRQEVALNDHGFVFEIAQRLSLMDGIDRVRDVLGKCVFHRTNCARLISALGAYHKEWLKDKGLWSDKPSHDWTSHPADSFRYFAVSGFQEGSQSLGMSLVEKGAR